MSSLLCPERYPFQLIMMLTETPTSRTSKPANAPYLQPVQGSVKLVPPTADAAGAFAVRLPLKTELQALPFEERVRVLMTCADHHLEQMDLLEDTQRPEPLTAWERRQLTGHRGSLRRVLDRAREFNIRIAVVED